MQLSGQGQKITTPVNMIIARSSGECCFGQAHDVNILPEACPKINLFMFYPQAQIDGDG